MLLCGTACIANGRFWISRKGNEGFTQRRNTRRTYHFFAASRPAGFAALRETNYHQR